jgi:hypothetical protein
VGGKISSTSESSAPFDARAAGNGREEFFFAPEILRTALRFADFRAAFFGFAFGFRALGRLTLVGFFGEGRALRRACFLE